MDDRGLENAAILLMSLGEEDAANVFKHLSPKEVQGLGETITKMKSISRERVDGVLELFANTASEQSNLVSDTDEYVKTVLRRALGDDKANLQDAVDQQVGLVVAERAAQHGLHVLVGVAHQVALRDRKSVV